ncbi:MAG: 3-oxoacyl-ACP synthase III family protein [bacterium]
MTKKLNKTYAEIIGTGSALPPHKYTTHEMKKYFPQLDVEDALKQIGVKTRYFVRDFETDNVSHHNSELTCEAARAALDDAGLDVADLQLIVTATASPDYSVPNMACQVQQILGAKKAVATGILSGCGGFTHALTIASQFIENGYCETALVTGSEVLSPYLDFSHPKCVEAQVTNAAIFGDGAGAVVLKANKHGEAGIITNYIGSNGEKNPLVMHCGGSKSRPNREKLEDGLHFWDLNLRRVLALTPRYMIEATNEIQRKSDIKLNDIDWVIPHQPAMPLVRHFAKKIKYPLDKMVVHLEEVGDTADACLPISLDRANKMKQFKKGELILLVAAGAGWMYGANLIKW